MSFDTEFIIKQIRDYDNPNLSEREKLDLLLHINDYVNTEIKRLSTDREKAYATLLSLKIMSIVFGKDITDKKEVAWSPKKYADYAAIRHKITEQTGHLGKIITKSQYEQALTILKTIC